MTILKIQKSNNKYISDHIKGYGKRCIGCSLRSVNEPIIYRGNISAKIALIGEAPGKEEELQQIPFVGPAGKLLDKIFQSIDINTEDMLLTNVLWCRPKTQEGCKKQNYTPKKEQIKKCWPYTKDLLKVTKPKIIIACGASALKAITGMEKVRMKDYEGKWMNSILQIKIFVMRHPASILHLTKDPKEQKRIKQKVWQYMQYFKDTHREYL